MTETMRSPREQLKKRGVARNTAVQKGQNTKKCRVTDRERLTFCYFWEQSIQIRSKMFTNLPFFPFHCLTETDK